MCVFLQKVSVCGELTYMKCNILGRELHNL